MDAMVLPVVLCKEMGGQSLSEAITVLEGVIKSGGTLRFMELLDVCARFFGEARTKGSHHIFKTPWPGDPRINLQKDGKDAKRYQIKQVHAALIMLEKKI